MRYNTHQNNDSLVSHLDLSVSEDSTMADSQFFRLPPELSRRILTQLLCFDEYDVRVRPNKWLLQIPVLRVNRQLYHGAVEILHNKNTWTIISVATSLNESFQSAKPPFIKDQLPIRAIHTSRWPPALNLSISYHTQPPN